MTPETWIDREMYPFEHNDLEVDGGRMHYVDEGEGRPIVLCHGNPTWSFLYRHFIKGLSDKYRCVAPDYIGFGLSDKPADWSYKPEAHARNVRALIEHLGLENITLVGQDWGGPISMSYAVNNPDNVHSIVLMNTWMWDVSDEPHFTRFSGLLGSGVGQFINKQFNAFVNVVMKQATQDTSVLTDTVMRHYRAPLDTPAKRTGAAIFPKEIVASSEWLASEWEKSPAIADKPALLMWGMKDIAFREQELQQWAALFNDATVVRFEETGHYVQEEQGEALVPILREFLTKHEG